MASKLFRWGRSALSVVGLFIGVSLLANAWITRDHVTGVAPRLPLEQRIYVRGRGEGGVTAAPVLVYFYASWCPICKVDLPAIDSVAGRYPVVVVAMRSGGDEEVLRHRAEQGIDLDIINDEEGTLSRAFGVQGVPSAFVLDDDHTIRFSTQGYTGWIGYWTRLLLAEWF